MDMHTVCFLLVQYARIVSVSTYTIQKLHSVKVWGGGGGGGLNMSATVVLVCVFCS